MLLKDAIATASLRAMNEDRALTTADDAARGGRYMFAVSDGMGGAKFGDACAQIAVTAAREALKSGNASVRGAFDRANECVLQLKEMADAHESGATVCIGAIDGGVLRLCWTGDTACYLYRAGELETLAWPERTQAGHLINYLGKWHGLAPYYGECALAVGDRILVATDGAYEDLGAGLIKGYLAEMIDPREIANTIAAEGSRRTRDDATALVIEVGED